MGIMDVFSGKKKMRVSSRDILVLTPLGKTKAEQFNMPGKQWRMLSLLNENGPSSVYELANEMGTDEEKANAIARELISQGFVRRSVGTE